MPEDPQKHNPSHILNLDPIAARLLFFPKQVYHGLPVWVLARLISFEIGCVPGPQDFSCISDLIP